MLANKEVEIQKYCADSDKVSILKDKEIAQLKDQVCLLHQNEVGAKNITEMLTNKEAEAEKHCAESEKISIENDIQIEKLKQQLRLLHQNQDAANNILSSKDKQIHGLEDGLATLCGKDVSLFFMEP